MVDTGTLYDEVAALSASTVNTIDTQWTHEYEDPTLVLVNSLFDDFETLRTKLVGGSKKRKEGAATRSATQIGGSSGSDSAPTASSAVSDRETSSTGADEAGGYGTGGARGESETDGARGDAKKKSTPRLRSDL